MSAGEMKLSLPTPEGSIDGDTVEEIERNLSRVTPFTYTTVDKNPQEIMRIKAALIGEYMRESRVPDSEAKHAVCETLANLQIISRVVMDEILHKKATNERIRMLSGMQSNIRRTAEVLGIGVMTDPLRSALEDEQEKELEQNAEGEGGFY